MTSRLLLPCWKVLFLNHILHTTYTPMNIYDYLNNFDIKEKMCNFESNK